MKSQIPNLVSESMKKDASSLSKLSLCLADFKTQTVNETSQMILSEVQKLSQFNKKIDDLLLHIATSKQKCSETTNNLINEEKGLRKQVDEYKDTQKKNDVEGKLRNQIKDLEKEYVSICKERIKVAESINIKKLQKIQIQDRKSTANEIFKWILVAIYTEPESKFYWPNFCEQAFQNDSGQDLIERLGKVTSMNTKDEQRLKTQYFLDSYEKIESSPELKNVKEEMKKIYNVALNFRNGYKIASEISEYEGKIEKNKFETLTRDEENIRSEARISALEGRIEVNKSFLKIMEYAQTQLASKKPVYEQKIASGSKGVEELQKLNEWKPKINIQSTSGGQCQECRLF